MGAISSQDLLLLLIKQIDARTFKELMSDRFYRNQTEDFLELKKALLNKSAEDWCDKHLSLGKGLFALDEMDVDRQPNSVKSGKDSGRGKGKGKPKPHPKLVRQTETGQKEVHQKFSATVFCKYCQKKGHYEADCWFQFLEKRPKFSGKSRIGEVKAKVVHQKLKQKISAEIHRISQNLVEILTSQNNQTKGQE